MELVCSQRLPPPPFAVGAVVVERPPEVPKVEPVNVVARLLPLAMVVAVGGMAALYFTSGAASSRSPMTMIFPVMMLVSALGSVAYGARGTRRSRELDADRSRYLRYLDSLGRSLARTAEAQHASLHWSHPSPAALWALAGGARRWERRATDADFCHVRVGLGTVGLSTPLVVPEPAPAGSHDPVTALELARLVVEHSTVTGVPVTVDLVAHPRIVVTGDVRAARDLVRAMLCQLAVLHGPDVVGICATGPAAGEWDWLKWLPHHRPSGDFGSTVRRVVVFDGAGDPDVDDKADGLTLIAIDHPLVGDCLHLDVAATTVFACPDALPVAHAVVCARTLARFRSDILAAADAAHWSALVGVGDPASLDAPRVWRPMLGRRRLRVAVGVSDRGEPVELDLKEAAEGGMGPHGLCVGATGSGKSEFLRTLALGLIATHGPDALNLVLVDFKGGATFLGFDRLSHVAAVVTNLSEEAHLVARMRDALAGEMTRRQELLRAAGQFANVADYDVARSAGADLVPLPALVIVVDEFSELLSQHPDFVELFVAIGRVGRSLGMHLLLASQRLDEGRLRGLETHLSYRICLKTFSANESRAVLGTVDAYELPTTPGAALLKTASGDVVRFRAAFVSAPVCAPAPSREAAPEVFTAMPVEPPRFPSADSRSLLEVVVDALAGRGEPAHRVWLPPLATSPTLGALLEQDESPLGPLIVPIGLVDNPFAQRREVFLVDLSGAGGNVAVVGGPRAGKTTALHTLIMGLAATHDPDRVQIYGLDFGGGHLAPLSMLPHVGAIAGRFERDLSRRIVAHVQGLVRQRATGHANAGDAFLVIDGWAVVRHEFEGMEEGINAIAAQGLSVGVHVVIAASRWADLRPALKDRLTTRIELRLGDPADSEMDRKRARFLTDRPSGHGITREGLEFSVALPYLAGVDAGAGAANALRCGAQVLTRRHVGRAAPVVRLLPAVVPHAGIALQSPGRFVLGLGEDELRPVAVDFATHRHLLILGDTACGKTATLRTVCREIVRTSAADAARILVIDVRRTLLGVVESDHLLGYAMSRAGAESHVANTVALLTSRLPGEHVTQAQLRDRSWWNGPEVYVVVDDYDLVAGAAGNPLMPLLDLLPHARDLGLHVVLARRSGGAARAMFDPFLALLRDLGCMGLMMSASPDEGVLLGSARPSPLAAGRAALICRGQPDQVIQVSWTDPP